MVKVLICLISIFCFNICQSKNIDIDSLNNKESLFPDGSYTPNGYLSNPYHTASFNRSGVLRSVPPLGFGFWARPLPWPYGGAEFGFGLSRHRNYISLLNFAIEVDGIILNNLEDYKNNKIEISSNYHTKNIFNYLFNLSDLEFDLSYFQVGEHSLVCNFQVENKSNKKQNILINAINVFGDIYKGYWGCDGIVSNYNEKFDLSISKFFADGDMFAMGSTLPSLSFKATSSDSLLNQWILSSDTTHVTEPVSLRIREKITEEGKSLGHMNNLMTYKVDIIPNEKKYIKFIITRGVNEKDVIDSLNKALSLSAKSQIAKIEDDNNYYRNAPFLSGAWHPDWINGLIYHQETIRMNIHPPIGIYKHHWDGMQIHTPRAVLGETAIDAMALSYGDLELAKEVLLGVFADAPANNIPCSREDGSLNLVCGNGKETGTAPIWGLPFLVINSIYLRDKDDDWIKRLYPHMKDYIQWWLENRTDEEGWFHCACSWESGQDGSKRFRVGDVAASAEDVRTIDIEAAMAHAITMMVKFSRISGFDKDEKYWKKLSEIRIQRTRNMFVDGRFRDFDAKTGKPIILGDYYSVMMLAPLSFNIATIDQKNKSYDIFDYFKKNYRFWLEWPSFLFPFTEAAWNSNRLELLGEILMNSGNGIFPGTNSKKPLYIKPKDAPGLSKKYSYRLPGVAAEWWPYKRENMWAGGCENYGWGATFPTLLIRNIIGFRELNNENVKGFTIAPALNPDLFKEDEIYKINNLNYRDIKINISYRRTNKNVFVQLNFKSLTPIYLSFNKNRDHEPFVREGEITFEVDNYSKTSIYVFN